MVSRKPLDLDGIHERTMTELEHINRTQARELAKTQARIAELTEFIIDEYCKQGACIEPEECSGCKVQRLLEKEELG